MADVANDILASIKNDKEFKYNPVIMAVVENLEKKRASYQFEEDFLKLMKESLAQVNAYVQNPRIEKMLVKVDERLGDSAVTNVHTKVRNMYYEIELPAAINAIRESSAYSEPVVKNYVDSAIMEMQNGNIPYFKYMPSFIATMSVYRVNETVNEWVTKFEKYVTENRKKLIVLESVHYLDGIGNGFYHGVTEKLKHFLVANDCSSSKIMLEMKEFSSMQILKDMVVALQAEESAVMQQFNLGPGDGNTKVYNYIGPVLKENNNMVFFIDGAFINLTTGSIDEKNVRHVFGKSGDITVQEITPEYVYESMSQYYQMAKSFEYLGFNVDDRKVWTKLRNVKVDFRVNESGNLDLYINDSMIEKPKDVNFHQMFVLENNYVKNCSSTLFNNMDKIYNVEFIKLLVNEAKGAAAIVININEEYYVYDFVDAKKRDIYKADGFALQKFIGEKFGYDVRNLFNIQINDVKSKVQSIDNKKRDIETAIAKLEESEKLLVETIAKPGVQPKDIVAMKELREKVERQIVALRNEYIMLEDERSQSLGQRQAESPVDYKLGDNVSFGEGNGRIVAVPSSTSDTTYMVYTSEGRTQKVDKSQMQKSDAQAQQQEETTQETNEGKKSQETQSQETQSQETQSQEGQSQEGQSQETQSQEGQSQETQSQEGQSQETQSQETQSQETQSQEGQSQETQSQEGQSQETQSQEGQSQETQSQEGQSQETQQGVIPQGQPTEAGKFQKISSGLGELQSALETVRPEVREKFEKLAGDMQTLIQQVGDLERIHGDMQNIKSEKVDLAKVQKKFDKIMSDLESVTKELTGEFGKGAQEVVVSESLISSAYDKYIGVVTSVADKLGNKVSTIVNKLNTELIDLDADVKVLTTRAQAAQAKDNLSSQASAAQIPVAGPQAADAAAQDNAQPVDAQAQMTQTLSQPTIGTQPQAQQEETQQQQQEETQPVQEKYTAESLGKMTIAELAAEYATLFGMNESEIISTIEANREECIGEILQEYEAFKKRDQK